MIDGEQGGCGLSRGVRAGWAQPRRSLPRPAPRGRCASWATEAASAGEYGRPAGDGRRLRHAALRGTRRRTPDTRPARTGPRRRIRTASAARAATPRPKLADRRRCRRQRCRQCHGPRPRFRRGAAQPAPGQRPPAAPRSRRHQERLGVRPPPPRAATWRAGPGSRASTSSPEGERRRRNLGNERSPQVCHRQPAAGNEHPSRAATDRRHTDGYGPVTFAVHRGPHPRSVCDALRHSSRGELLCAS